MQILQRWVEDVSMSLLWTKADCKKNAMQQRGLKSSGQDFRKLESLESHGFPMISMGFLVQCL